jgi:hypothetical protein
LTLLIPQRGYHTFMNCSHHFGTWS